ncbi:hypothetical protein [Bartonella tribocorum]|uniref:hypothetical protein n=1 Tax=Bartonella tribocorum TaxID=85701 RepID=UPI00031001E3|nr:hypothetical protein [Bartonella tribocorum]CDO49589.1 hypothetical membrane protein [Bartonella tribocorum]
MKSSSLFDQKQLSLVWQDYKKIFTFSTVMVTLPTIITVLVKIWRKKGFFSAAILEPLAWILAGAFLFLPVVFMMLLIVTRQLKKTVQQLEEEVEQKKAPVILYNVSEGKK